MLYCSVLVFVPGVKRCSSNWH